jgi:puromycin-sensitive aminopeptidase
MGANPYRLGNDIKPILYDLSFEPDLEKFTFKCHETLHLEILKPITRITLHAVDLKIHSADISKASSKNSKNRARKISYDEKMETVTFYFSDRLKPGRKYRLHLGFSGELNDKMSGFYRTSYFVNGQKRWGAATQFEATDARRAFVCLDEPAFKARFHATLKVPSHLTALSNMPVEKETADRFTGKKVLHYKMSPIMSTYLLCFVVAELEYLEGKDKNGVPIGIWTTPGKKEQGRFALEVAQHTLPYFSEWFGIPYALPKLDMVALPDFSSGAMENWGLVTYRESALLVDAKNSSASAKQRVAEVIDHELAHQWFGNLVTMEWWTDLWLNEGFASYMGPKAVDHQFPEWKIWSQYVATEYLTALHDDALISSHPIEIPVKHPHEIREIFDHITYNKGSAVNRMLEHYLGETVFRKGLRKYLKRFAYRNASTADLWKALEEASGQPVRAIMDTYTRQEGYPILSVAKEEKNKKSFLKIRQKRFIFDGRNDPKKLNWKVPLTLGFQSAPQQSSMLLRASQINVSLNARKGWIKLNPGRSGFYRARYSEALFKELIRALERREVSAIDGMGLVDDAWALARAGSLKTSAVLEILRVCREQTDYNLWLTLSGALGSIENIRPQEGIQKPFAGFARALFADIGKKSGWDAKDSDTHLDHLRRSLVISQLGHFGERAVIEEARARFAGHVSGATLDPNLRGAVYAIVAEHGGDAELKKLLDLYKKTDLQEEKVRLLRALTRFQTAPEIEKALDFSLSAAVRAQDMYVILAGFGGNAAARNQNWRFVKSKWEKITALYHSGSIGLLGHILEGSASSFSEATDLEDVKRFFTSHPVPGTERTRKQTLEIIRSNIAWRCRDASDIETWLAHRGVIARSVATKQSL